MRTWHGTGLSLFGIVLLLVSAPAAGFSGNGEFTGVKGWVSLNGERVSGVTVSAYREYERGPASGAVAISDPSGPDGTFSVGLPAGNYFLVAAKTERGTPAGLRTGDLFCFFGGNPVRVEEGRRTAVALNLQRVGADPESAAASGITGTVYDARGIPLPGAVVYAYQGAADGFKGMPGVFTRTREDGTFHLRVRKGTFFVLARKRGSGELFGPTLPGDSFGFYPGNPITLVEGRGRGIRIDTQSRQDMREKMGDAYGPPPAIVLRAKVVEVSGRPAAGVRLLAYRNEGMTGFPAFVSARSGTTGSVTLEVAEEGTYFLLAREKLGGPAEGELFGKFAGTKDHSVKVTRDGAAGTIEIVVERK